MVPLLVSIVCSIGLAQSFSQYDWNGDEIPDTFGVGPNELEIFDGITGLEIGSLAIYPGDDNCHGFDLVVHENHVVALSRYDAAVCEIGTDPDGDGVFEFCFSTATTVFALSFAEPGGTISFDQVAYAFDSGVTTIPSCTTLLGTIFGSTLPFVYPQVNLNVIPSSADFSIDVRGGTYVVENAQPTWATFALLSDGFNSSQVLGETLLLNLTALSIEFFPVGPNGSVAITDISDDPALIGNTIYIQCGQLSPLGDLDLSNALEVSYYAN